VSIAIATECLFQLLFQTESLFLDVRRLLCAVSQRTRCSTPTSSPWVSFEHSRHRTRQTAVSRSILAYLRTFHALPPALSVAASLITNSARRRRHNSWPSRPGIRQQRKGRWIGRQQRKATSSTALRPTASSWKKWQAKHDLTCFPTSRNWTCVTVLIALPCSALPCFKTSNLKWFLIH
jgi:hypothetical protein